MIRVAVSGAGGRMGRLIVRLVCEDEGLQLVGALESPSHPDLGRDAGSLAGVAAAHVSLLANPKAALADADVVIDFSTPAAARHVFEAARAVRAAAVVGTTGLDGPARAEIERTAEVVPIVAAPNMSVGVNVLFRLVAEATRLLGDGYDAEIAEIHHSRKVDAPSGTALRLAETVARVRGLDPSECLVHGRFGAVGERRSGEIGVVALRGGDVVGDHTVVFAGPGERVELTHRSGSRENFALGAVRAARWVVGRRPGMYGMDDVLCIAEERRS